MYAGEVSVGSMIVHGIEICTRHGKAYELAEMINFCVAAAGAGLERRVKSVFYDSNSCCCTFELAESIGPYDDVDETLRELALNTISQFEWNSTIEHGQGLDLGFLDKLTHSS
ncbi:hypothetical protein BK652_10030 [Pseudomonas brassicacearum]|uniref:Uncharacterized protein n=1 Tax=Pseudomonas brassicacearum TaxID=930166 RepID=A0A423GDH4_9PSED|nr:hypothetical protein [Pseudomonas brassicacearum]ROM84907.1 hypothetical protein BK652_10030 [Pseudomonas brassicacearum]